MKTIFKYLKYKILKSFIFATLISSIIYAILLFLQDSIPLSKLEINIIIVNAEIFLTIQFLHAYYCEWIEKNCSIQTLNLYNYRLFNVCNKGIAIDYIQKKFCGLSNLCNFGNLIIAFLLVIYFGLTREILEKNAIFLLIMCIPVNCIYSFQFIISSKADTLEKIKDKIDLSGFERYDEYLDNNIKFKRFVITNIWISVIAFIVFLIFSKLA